MTYKNRKRSHNRKLFEILKADRVVYELEELDEKIDDEDDF